MYERGLDSPCYNEHFAKTCIELGPAAASTFVLNGIELGLACKLLNKRRVPAACSRF